ncbi:MAG: hypothetical protein KFF73_20780, partial [Cyclobacteriaceae bacterium]|nr:hypothetical protein [Cyclobacteriaceae bacterium]
MRFNQMRIYHGWQLLLSPALLFMITQISYAQLPKIESVSPLDLCVGETVTIKGKKLKDVTHVVFNEVNLFKSAGDYRIVDKSTITFEAPLAAATNGQELVTTRIFIGSYSFFPADRQDNLMSVNRLPQQASNPAGSTFCEGDPVSPVSVQDPGNNYRIDWYNRQTDGNLLNSGISYTPPEAGTYYAEVVNVSTGCVSSRVPVTSTEMPAPDPPTGAKNSAQCPGEPVNPISVNDPANGFRIDWYSAAAGGNLLSSGSVYTPPGPGTYYAEKVNINTSCPSLTRVAVIVTLNPSPPKASNPVDAFYCGTDQIPAIRVDDPGNGFTVKWYAQATGTAPATGSSSGKNGEIFTPGNNVSATYYAEIENDQTGCTSISRTAVRIEKNPPGCTDTNISSYFFNEQDGSSVIDYQDHSISAKVIYGTSLNKLVANYTIPQNAVATVAGVIQRSGVTSNDFSRPVTYTITAADGITRQNWDVSVDVAPNRRAEILTFSIPEQTKGAVIDRNNHIITVEVVVWTDLSQLVANFTLSDGATAYIGNKIQESGVTVNNFTETLTYTVIAQDEISTQNWRIRVKREDIKDDQDPVILSAVLPEEYPVLMDSIQASVRITDNIGISHVVFRYKKYQDTQWNQKVIRSADSLYTCYINETLTGNHGMIYYFKAYDYKNNTDSTEVANMVLRYNDENSPEIPGLRFGHDVQDYQMVSIPLFLDAHAVEKVFDELMPYDIKRWRLFHYSGGITGEYGQGFTMVTPGKSYWLIVRDERRINVGGGITNRITNGNGFSAVIQPGWNQIGNPYSFDISWDDVILYNGNVSVNRVKTYQNGVLFESETLPAYGGGFVFSGSEEFIQLNLPPNSGFKNVRRAGKEYLSLSGGLGSTSWFLPFAIQKGDY